MESALQRCSGVKNMGNKGNGWFEEDCKKVLKGRQQSQLKTLQSEAENAKRRYSNERKECKKVLKE